MSTLNVIEAAEVLKVHPKTVLDLIGNGELPAAKIGRGYVMLQRDVLAYIEKQVTAQTAARVGAPYKRRSPQLAR